MNKFTSGIFRKIDGKTGRICLFLVFLCFGTNSFSQSWLWAKGAGGKGVQEGWAMTSDASGNIYVTGTFNSRFISFGTDIPA